MEGFPWRFAFYFVAAVYLFADLYACHGPVRGKLLSGGRSWKDEGAAGVAAEVYGRPVTGLELGEALRAYLWRRGEAWSDLSDSAQRHARRLVLETLVNERIVHAFRVMNGIDGERPVAEAASELGALRRQFEDEETFGQRRQGQRLNQADLRERVQAAVDDEAWIEEKIAHRLAEWDEGQVQQWADANGDTLEVPEVWRVSHIYLSRHDPEKPGDRSPEIRALAERLKAGEVTFEELAAEASEDERTKRRRGDLGWFGVERMPADFMTAVKALKNGEVSAPVQTQLGWHLLRLDDFSAARKAEFKELEPEIRAKLVAELRERAVRSLIAELRERSFRPTVFVKYHEDVIESVQPAP
jgi:hypothetical protein